MTAQRSAQPSELILALKHADMQESISSCIVSFRYHHLARYLPSFSLGRHTLSAYLAFCMPTLALFFSRTAYTFRLFGFLYADASLLFPSAGIHFSLIWLFVCRRFPSFSLGWHTLSAYLAFCMPSLALFFSRMAYTFRLFGFLYAVARPLFLSHGIHFPLIWLFVCHRLPSFSLTWHTLSACLAFCMPSLALFFSRMAYTFRLSY